MKPQVITEFEARHAALGLSLTYTEETYTEEASRTVGYSHAAEDIIQSDSAMTYIEVVVRGFSVEHNGLTVDAKLPAPVMLLKTEAFGDADADVIVDGEDDLSAAIAAKLRPVAPAFAYYFA